jgi:choline monooxygenase
LFLKSLDFIIDSYDPNAPLERASTIPSSWYTDDRIFELEKRTVFSRSWQVAARVDQLGTPGDYVTSEIADEPTVIVRGSNDQIRAFFNACRHHAAAVLIEPQGNCPQMRCPYHGWTYSLEGELKGTPDFNDVCNFNRADNGLLPIETAIWEQWVFARVDKGSGEAITLEQSFGDLINQFKPLATSSLHWFERRAYTLNCNWKVLVDNYLDGGYHVPHLHKGLDSVLDYSQYTIENGERFCLQSSPIVSSHDTEVGSVRSGQRALYYWLYPNFMLNWYEGYLDTNLVLPLAIDKMKVIFEFYFNDVGLSAEERNRKSMDVSERIQDEDHSICVSVQRGLKSRAYGAGRLSVRREAGENLFHKLLHADLSAGIKNA